MFALIVFDCSIFEQAPAASARSVSALRTALRCRFLRSFFLQVFFVLAKESEEGYIQITKKRMYPLLMYLFHLLAYSMAIKEVYKQFQTLYTLVVRGGDIHSRYVSESSWRKEGVSSVSIGCVKRVILSSSVRTSVPIDSLFNITQLIDQYIRFWCWSWSSTNIKKGEPYLWMSI